MHEKETKESSTLYFNGYPDYYRIARDTYLSSKLPDYPALDNLNISLSFTINAHAKNGVIIYAILDTLPSDVFIVEKNRIIIKFDRKQFPLYSQPFTDILSVVKKWKSTVIKYNEVELDYEGCNYLLNFCVDNKIVDLVIRKTISELREEYLPKKKTRRKSNSEDISVLHLSRNNLDKALESIANRYIEVYGKNKNIQCYNIPAHRGRVVVVEDSLIVVFWVSPKNYTVWRECNDWEYPCIIIQELTKNDLFRFSFAGFNRKIFCKKFEIAFLPFRGINYYPKEYDKTEAVDRVFPNLNIKERLQRYPGEVHHFIILRMEGADNEIYYGIGETKQKIHTYVMKICSELLNKQILSLEGNGISCLPFPFNRDFINAFISWKGKTKQWRLEKKFSYSYEDISINNDLDIPRILEQILANAKKGKYNNLECGSYCRPVNKWKSEELVYNISKKLYKDYQVIRQYSPFYLATDRGYMSYDVYICGLKIAIEYQGKQHFEPVDYFGGADSFIRQRERDILKAKRSKENNVSLIYINYWENITPDLIKKRIEEALYDKRSNSIL